MINARRFMKRPESTILLSTLLMIVIFIIIDFHGFTHFFTIRNITRYTAILGFVAIGQTFLILVREIDLSVGSVYGVVGIAFVSFEPTLGVVGSFVAALLLGMLIGWLNSILVLRGGLAFHDCDPGRAVFLSRRHTGHDGRDGALPVE